MSLESKPRDGYQSCTTGIVGGHASGSGHEDGSALKARTRTCGAMLSVRLASFGTGRHTEISRPLLGGGFVAFGLCDSPIYEAIADGAMQSSDILLVAEVVELFLSFA